MAAFLEVRNLAVRFPMRRRDGKLMFIHSVNGVSFSQEKGEVLGVVGESGCGKSTLARSILGLETKSGGSILFKGKDIAQLDKSELQSFRKTAQMVFQDPFSSLNRRKTVQQLLYQPLRIHKKGNTAENMKIISSTLAEVGLHTDMMHRYPHQFSGGQRQRVAIARSLVLNPELLVCDEAVSALDLSVQAQIINLLLDLREKHDLTYLFIAHDLSVIEFISDRILVLYLGRIMEIIAKKNLRKKALHPYTRMLIEVSPQATSAQRRKKIAVPSGEVPSPINLPQGCFFASRCPSVMEKCWKTHPPMRETECGHWVTCWLYDNAYLTKRPL